MILGADSCGSEIDAGIGRVEDGRCIGHRRRVPGSRAASEVSPRSEAVAIQGSMVGHGLRRVAHVEFPRHSFPRIRFQSMNRGARSTVFRSIRIPSAPNKALEPTTMAVTI